MDRAGLGSGASSPARRAGTSCLAALVLVAGCSEARPDGEDILLLAFGPDGELAEHRRCEDHDTWSLMAVDDQGAQWVLRASRLDDGPDVITVMKDGEVAVDTPFGELGVYDGQFATSTTWADDPEVPPHRLVIWTEDGGNEEYTWDEGLEISNHEEAWDMDREHLVVVLTDSVSDSPQLCEYRRGGELIQCVAFPPQAWAEHTRVHLRGDTWMIWDGRHDKLAWRTRGGDWEEFRVWAEMRWATLGGDGQPWYVDERFILHGVATGCESPPGHASGYSVTATPGGVAVHGMAEFESGVSLNEHVVEGDCVGETSVRWSLEGRALGLDFVIGDVPSFYVDLGDCYLSEG